MPNHREFFKEAFSKWAEDKPRGKLLDMGCRDVCLKDYFEEMGFEWEGCDPATGAKDGEIGSIDKAKGETVITTIWPHYMEECGKHFYEEFDVIVCVHSFEHCEQPVDALRNMQRALKPDGWLFIAGPPVCEHHILKADDDHIMVLGEMQMERLMIYTDWEEISTWTHSGNTSQNDTVCTVGKKKNVSGRSS